MEAVTFIADLMIVANEEKTRTPALVLFTFGFLVRMVGSNKTLFLDCGLLCLESIDKFLLRSYPARGYRSAQSFLLSSLVHGTNCILIVN